MGSIDPNKTVEEVVFGSALSAPRPPPQGCSCPPNAGPSRGCGVCNPVAGPRPTRTPRSASQPPRGRCASGQPPATSASYPGLPSTSPDTSRVNNLKQRIEEVENQIAMVNLALQNQGIETEMSEESQLRFMSFLQRRLRDLESKVALVEGATSAGGVSAEDSVERGRHAPRTRNVPSSDGADGGRHENIRSVMLELQDLIHNRD